jgi:hypothetical protein
MGVVDIVDIEIDIYIDNIDRTGEITRRQPKCCSMVCSRQILFLTSSLE